MRQAQELLAQAGWTIKDGVLVNDKGERFQFEILLTGGSFERVIAPYAANLGKLGITVNYRSIDSALYADRVKNVEY